MQQLTYVKPRILEWRDVPEPELERPTDALVRPFVAARCDGDTVFLRNDFDTLLRVGAATHLVDPRFRRAADSPFHGPFAYGHECVAEVIQLGSEVTGFEVGQRVVVPWAVSCGACARCRSGLTSNCSAHTQPLAAYGFGDAIGGYGGMVSDVLRVPYADAMLVAVPDGLDSLSVASASDNLPDAYRTVAPHLAATPGAEVLVVGGGAKSIGLYAVGIARALGASRVDYVDSDATRLRLAEALGANAVEQSRNARWFRRGEPILEGGYPIAVEASSGTAGLVYALGALSPGGVCTGVGFYLRRGTPLPLWPMYLKSGTLHVGVSHPRRDLPALLALLERCRRQGGFDPKMVASLVAPWNDAKEAFVASDVKVVVQRERLLPRAAA